MSNRAILGLLPLLLAGVTHAQIGPWVIEGSNGQMSSPGLDPVSVGTASVQQINFVKDPALGAGIYHCTLTVEGLPTGMGGAGGADLLSGTYDAQNDTFTANFDAAGFNGTATEFGLMYLPATGQDISGVTYGPADVAVYDSNSTPTGVAQIAVRNPITGFFEAPGQPSQLSSDIGGIASGFIDPSLGIFHGKIHLVWIGSNSNGQAILAAPLDINNATGPMVVGQPFAVADALSTPNAGTPHSPTVVTGGDGDSEALIYCSNDPTGDSDVFWTSFIDLSGGIAAQAFQLEDSNDWSNNGGYCAGNIIMGHSAPTYHTYRYKVAFMTGDDETVTHTMPNRTVDMGIHVPIVDATSLPYAAIVFIDTSLSPIGPITIPGFDNALSIQYAGLLPPFVIPAIPNAEGETFLAFPIPSYVQGTLYAQTLVAQPNTAGGFDFTFTNEVPIFM